MVPKRIIRWMAGLFLIALLVFTVISNSVYQANLPRVRTQVVEQELGEVLDKEKGILETFAWVPRECVFPGSRADTVCVYRIGQRAGQFAGTEYYAEEVEVPVLDEREDAILVEDLYLGLFETLVCETDNPLSDGQTLVWLNAEK